jgi:DNA-directed RNA polymerase specialized sigma subunit
MTAKEYLNQAYWLDRRIDSKLEQLSALRDTATKTSAVMDGEVVSHTRNVHSLQDVIAKIIDMQEEINGDIDALVDLKRDIMRTIREIEDPEAQTVLELRYLCFKRWEEISVIMNYSVRRVYQIHDEALEKIPVPEALQ